MTYQGHLPDGSSVQKHSAGSCYPLIVVKRHGSDKPWSILFPDGHEDFFADGVECCRMADETKERLYA